MSPYHKILHQYWGYDDFRGIQLQIIESISQGRDTLGLMPTGGGKSITFQVPALLKEGVCVVVTPLIALMKDQVAHLRKKGILASAIHSGMSHQEILTTLDNAIYGGVKILYVSPERLASDFFIKKLNHVNVSFVTVDEAHCISQWGYDFRPAYLKISEIRNIKPDVPILALTATATTQVVDDIQLRLGFREKSVFRMSFERKNLSYVVRRAPDKQAELIHLLASVKGCAIVYVRSRRRSREIATLLNEHNISATFYHAGLEHPEKDRRQRDWQNDKVRVMVATNAFGMGIDKPDVRLVAHIDCPDSIEAYFQEAGRAGRDGGKSYAVLLYNDSDKRKLNKRIADNFPTKEYIRLVNDHVADYFQLAAGSGEGAVFEFDIDKFCHAFKHFPVQVDAALTILQRAGYIEYDTDPDNSARLMFLLERDQLYMLQQTTPMQEKVITSLLRLYGGLFTDYCFISESMVAHHAGLDTNTVYQTLKELSRRNILHFIPRRDMPAIRYTKRREIGERLYLTPEVYEMRKEAFEKRIEAMIDYATNDTLCRSRQLLAYFGEYSSHECGQCDVCVAEKQNNKHEPTVAEQILSVLADHQKHHLSELLALHLPKHQLTTTIEYLVGEELVRVDGAYVYAL